MSKTDPIYDGFLPLVGRAFGLDAAVFRIGVSLSRGRLINLSHQALADDPIDRSKPTIVVTHGWNPASLLVRYVMMQNYAAAICQRLGDRCNVLGWDWNSATVHGFTRRSNSGNANRRGRHLAEALIRIDIDRANTQLIGFSFGANLVASAAHALWEDRREPIAQLTLLDPLEDQHETIFGQFRAMETARIVENYWSGKPSGLGAIADYEDLYQREVPVRNPWLAKILVTFSAHLRVPVWYYRTINDLSSDTGFNNSFVLETIRDA